MKNPKDRSMCRCYCKLGNPKGRLRTQVPMRETKVKDKTKESANREYTETRKIVQIAFEHALKRYGDDGSYYINPTTHALCNDGTIWYYSVVEMKWLRWGAPIPQDEI